MTYSDQEKAEGLARYLEVGASEAARLLGIPARTIRYWANQADLATARTQNLEDAGKMLAVSHQRMREEFRLRLMEKALDALDRMDQKHIDYRGKDATMVTWEVAPSGAFKDYATAAAILDDKYRLEMGEATSRVHSKVEIETDMDTELRRTAEEWKQQLQSKNLI